MPLVLLAKVEKFKFENIAFISASGNLIIIILAKNQDFIKCRFIT
jgi:hypothetical protein